MDDFLAGEGGPGEKNAKHLLSKDIYSNLEHSCRYYHIDKLNNMTKIIFLIDHIGIILIIT